MILPLDHVELNVVLFASSQKVAALKSRVDAAVIPAAKKADIRAKIVQLQVSSFGSTLSSFVLVSTLVRILPSFW